MEVMARIEERERERKNLKGEKIFFPPFFLFDYSKNRMPIPFHSIPER